jgi:Flp pilus assembly protein TadD
MSGYATEDQPAAPDPAPSEESPPSPSPEATPAPATGPLQQLNDRIRRLAASLEAPASEADSIPLRDELVGLVREIDASLDALRAMRESLRPLAERYKQIYPRPVPSAPQVVDHLGASTYRERGWSALSTGAYEEAVGQLRGAIDRDPTDPGALAMLAWAYLHLGREVDAAKVLERALARDGAHPLTRTIAGLAHLRGGRAEPAVAMLRTVAYDDAGTDRTARMYAHLYLGVAFGQSGRAEEARMEIRRALEIGPNLTEAWWELGRIHAMEGDRDSAVNAWRRGAENRFSGWGERCRAEVEREAARADTEVDGPPGEPSSD